MDPQINVYANVPWHDLLNGLPIVPPTEELVAKFLAAARLDAAAVIGVSIAGAGFIAA